MNKSYFKDIIAENFSEIYRNFQIGLTQKGYKYDEDIMSDAYLSCCNALKDRLVTKSEAIKYYWTAYINKFKTAMSKQNFIVSIEDMDENEDVPDVPDSQYDETIDDIYKLITFDLQDKYGVRDACIWELHSLHGMTSKSIRDMGYIKETNLAYLSKKMKRYIKNHIIRENSKLKELIKNRKES